MTQWNYCARHDAHYSGIVCPVCSFEREAQTEEAWRAERDRTLRGLAGQTLENLSKSGTVRSGQAPGRFRLFLRHIGPALPWLALLAAFALVAAFGWNLGDWMGGR